jgi:hypothetical protein
MSVPVQDWLPDLAYKPASDPLEPERTELANGGADGHAPELADGSADVFRRLAEIRARSNRSARLRRISAEAIRAAPNGGSVRVLAAFLITQRDAADQHILEIECRPS